LCRTDGQSPVKTGLRISPQCGVAKKG